MKTRLRKALAIVLLVCAARAWLSDEAADSSENRATLDIRPPHFEIGLQQAQQPAMPARRSRSGIDGEHLPIRQLERLWEKAERAKLLAAAVQTRIVALLRDIAAYPSVGRTDREIGQRRASVVDSQSNRKPPTSQRLFDEISHMDSVLFDAFNARNLDKIKTLFTEDLEFYHDKGGLDSYQQSMEKIKKLFDQNNGMRRELVKGSLEVYPIKDYGAIEIGAHVFSHVENGKEVRGTFQFVNIWRKKDGGWKVSRVISYDH
jgi:hypothetical protein